MKFVLALATVFAASAHADLSHLKCTVGQIDGTVISYLPPVKGDALTLNLSGNQIDDLTFASRNMVPILNPLKRNPRLPKTIHSYTAVQDDDSTQTQYLSLVANDQGNGLFQVQIQQVDLDKQTGLFTQAQVNMSCRE